MARLSLTWEADETPPYAFCELVFATSLRPWCIRKLGKAGLKLGGGIDTPSLCGRVQPSCTSGGKGSGGLGQQRAYYAAASNALLRNVSSDL